MYQHSCSFFFFKQKTAYEMRISDWSSDVCSSDIEDVLEHHPVPDERIDRMLERRRPVLLEEEVSHPGKTVAAHERAEQPPCDARHDTPRHQRQHAAAHPKKHPSRSPYGVFSH